MWIYNEKLLLTPPKGSIGFVYLIERINILENNISPIYYIGKKNFYHTGKKNKGIESDWISYMGSSSELLEDYNKYGDEAFIKRILHICYSQAELTYKETMEQILNDVLNIDKFSTMPKLYYNKSILGKFYNNKHFTNNDIERVKEYLSESNHWSYFYYITDGEVTKRIFGDRDDWNEIQEQYPNYRLGSNIHNTNEGKIWVNNGVSLKLVEREIINDFLLKNKEWTIGFLPSRTKGMVMFTNGEDNILINSDEKDIFLLNNPDFRMGSKYRGNWILVTNNIITKKILEDELQLFLTNNPTFKIKTDYFKLVTIMNPKTNNTIRVSDKLIYEYLEQGWILSTNENKHEIRESMKWYNNDICEIKIYEKSPIPDGFKEGRLPSKSKNRISITKNDKVKYISNSEIFNYIAEGWKLGGTGSTLEERNKIYVCSDIEQKQQLINKDEVELFLTNNPNWRLGQFKRDNFSTRNKTIVKNIFTDERTIISTEEYEDFFNHDYVGINTTKVSIRKNKKIIFKGYLKQFLRDNKIEVHPKYFNKFIKKTYSKITSTSRGPLSKIGEMQLEIKRE